MFKNIFYIVILLTALNLIPFETATAQEKSAADSASVKKPASATVGATASDAGFSIKSSDNNFALKFKGLIQADTKVFVDDFNKAANDQIGLRNARLDFQGILYKDFEFRLLSEYGDAKAGDLLDSYLEYKKYSILSVRIGKQKPQVGLEKVQARNALLFAESPLSDNLVPNRDIGILFYGKVNFLTTSYSFGIFDGVENRGQLDNDLNDQKEVHGRIFLEPFQKSEDNFLKGLGFGVSGTFSDRASEVRPSYKTSGRTDFFKYKTDVNSARKHFRISPQGYFYWNSLGLSGDYVQSTQKFVLSTNSAELDTKAWSFSASYVLFGGVPSFNSVKPETNFDPDNGTWGALEVAVRLSSLKIDNKAFPIFADPTKYPGQADASGFGINWYLNKAVKVVFNYEQTNFKSKSAVKFPSEKLVLTRVQFAF